MPDRLLAQDIVTMSREPLLVLDEQLTVIAASRSFYGTFGASQNETVGLPIARIANGLFDTPLLTQQLRRVESGQAMLENFEIRQDAVSGVRTFLLHTSAIRRDGGRGRGIMLTVEDVTERRRIEADCAEAVMSANNMLVELNHRIMNSFAMIGAIVTMEGRTQQDGNCRAAFDRMRSRITSIAHLYRNLGRSTAPEAVHADEYLKNIVSDLVTSLSHPERKIDVAVSIVQTPLPTPIAVPLGLIVNEVVTNSLKHAFDGRAHGTISVELTQASEHYVLQISDNGRGIDGTVRNASGLGQRLFETFARQLRGTAEQSTGPGGTTVTLRFPKPGSP